MACIEWQIEPIKYELRFDWSISRNTSTYKVNYLVLINKRVCGEFAPNEYFGESDKKIQEDIKNFLDTIISYNQPEDVLHFCDEARLEQRLAHSLLA